MPGTRNETFWTTDLGDLQGPWLGQTFTGFEPVEFCPAIFSTERHAFCTVFSPAGDEFFFVVNDLKRDIAHIAWTRMHNGAWARPQPAPFNSEFNDNDICMSPDGQRVYWRSWRPLPGTDVPEENSVLWAADRTGEGWSAPFPILCNGEIVVGGYPGIAQSGTVYFAGRRSPDDCCVYKAKRHGNMYGSREPILCGMNGGGDLCVAPDESFLIIACWHMPENNGDSDLYISFQSSDGIWRPLRNMGAPVNNEMNENCPMISPDGKRFFFFRYEPITRLARTYWIDAQNIERLR